MRQKNKRKIDKTAVALVLCFCVVAIASVFTVINSIDKLNNLANVKVPSSSQAPAKDRDAAEPSSTDIPTVDSRQSQAPGSNGSSKSSIKYAMPLEGEILKKYSLEVPIYSKTLDQYTVHEGIDISASEGTPVTSITEGTVTDIYTDDKYGLTIAVNHGNGYTGLYSNLADTKMVEIGDVIKKGQQLGSVGKTSLFETIDAPHLHFALEKDGTLADPLSLF